MENAKDLLHIYDQYLLLYPKETDRLEGFKGFISAFSGEQLYNRKNFAGHITASAIVVDATDVTVLLLEHKKLNRWLQPGGHVDLTDDSILYAALRELHEEANINQDQLRLISPSALNQIPLDIDSHLIPENQKRQEPEHYHHDIRYLFTYTGTKKIAVNTDEALNFKWQPLDNLESDNGLKGCIEKIHRLI